MPSTGDLLRELQAAHPAVADLVSVHVAEHDAVLPHLLMADITRWLVARGPQPVVLAVLEWHFVHGDVYTQEVIAASFLENLLGEDDRVRQALGPQLAEALRQREAWRPDPDAPPI